MLSGEATNIIFIAFGLTCSGLKPICTWDEHTNHYTTDVVSVKESNIAYYEWDIAWQRYKKSMNHEIKIILDMNTIEHIDIIHLTTFHDDNNVESRTLLKWHQIKNSSLNWKNK
jgi:hypothetical protein